MKRSIKTSGHFPKFALRTLFLILGVISALSLFGYDFEVNGIYYSKVYGNQDNVYVTSRDYEGNSYSGDVVIPGNVSYEGNNYTVTEIGYSAFANCYELSGISIPNTVVKIGEQAFSSCTGLTSVDIPNSVTTIEQAAFMYCTGLTSIAISDSISRIGAQAFSGCSGLTQIEIPRSVTCVAGCAFEACTGLKSLFIPNTLISIENGAFSRCSGLETIVVEEGNPVYDSRDNCNAIIETLCNEIVTGCNNTIIPNTIDSIGPMAFYECMSLNQISIPSRICSIESGAFWGCEGLNAVHINDLEAWLNILFADESSNPLFYAHHLFLNGQEVNNLIIPNSINAINQYVFSGFSALTEITIPNVVINIGEGSFSHCTGITGVEIPNSVRSIDANAFSNCTGLLSIDIPSSVSAIGDFAFSNCINLSDVTLTSSVTSMGYNVFGGTKWFNNQPDGIIYLGQMAYDYKGSMPSSSTLCLREGTIGIAGGAFSGFSGLIGVDMPNSVKTIGSGAFSSCYNLKSVHIPNSVISIGTSAFVSCWGLTDLTIGNNVTTIGQGAFANCAKLKSLVIPNSVVSIYGGAFSIMSLDTLVIGNSVFYIDYEAFASCIVKNLIWNPKTCSSKGAFNTEYIESVVIGDEVEVIPSGFVSNSKISNLIIPKSVKYIASSAFIGCNQLASIEVANENTIFDSRDNCNAIIERESNSLIAGCNNTVIPSSVTTIGTSAFQGLTSLTSISIPENVDSIARNAFYGCNSLTEALIPNSVKVIESYAFRNCSNLNNLTIGKSVANIGSYAFYGCSRLDTITCLAKTPPVLYDSYTFNCYNTATLQVPYSSLESYQTSEKWNRFANIVALDPINIISVPDTAALHGHTIVVPVSLENESEITAFQTDIYLPEGFELVKEDGDYQVELSERKGQDHVIMANDLDDGGIRVLCYSPSIKSFIDSEGDLFYIIIKTPDNGDGEYTLWLKNTLLTTIDKEELSAPDTSCVVTVYPYIIGDANNSGTVTVTDVVVTARYILNYNPYPFIQDAADINGDGNITVTDVVLIAQMVLDGTVNVPHRAPAVVDIEGRMSGKVINSNGELSIVSIMLDNNADYTAFQIDMQLPEGMIAENFTLNDQSGSHTLDVNLLDDGKMRLLCYSPDMQAFNIDGATLLTFEVVADAGGNSDILVDGIEMVTTACQTMKLDAFTIKMDKVNSVDELPEAVQIFSDGQNIIVDSPKAIMVNVCDLMGRDLRVDVNAGRTVIPTIGKGIYIVNAVGKVAKLMIR